MKNVERDELTAARRIGPPRHRIAKCVADLHPRPHRVDYEAARADFSWQRATALLDGLPDGRGINIAHEAVDRHVL